ncbi:CBS domain-containing protein [Litoreibacter roseus]|uniref:Inosine-5-monophosphate dehydrogenase n=1 Tax=Litoreibacter roseus TaxID=2601869 RepID=A0A6N6JJL1_9RHOB|nr:CBS domain-containing protein [Litoreibacter roseus]GFE66030.1 inosine-5-monophosphate dehydrogenase [Litoreibacter roseus]
MLVRQILKSKNDDGVVTIAPDATVSDAAQLLSARRIGSVVVSTDGKNADGILSERDIVREIGKRGPACLSEQVSQMMTRSVQTCACDDKADAILARMTEGRFRHMPVEEAGQMVGLITLGDVVKARLSELSMEKDALEGMIMGH